MRETVTKNPNNVKIPFLDLSQWSDLPNAKDMLAWCTKLREEARNKSFFELVRVGDNEYAYRYKLSHAKDNCKLCPCQCPRKFMDVCHKRQGKHPIGWKQNLTPEQLEQIKEFHRQRKWKPKFTNAALWEGRLPTDVELRADCGLWLDKRPLVVTRLRDQIKCFPGLRKGDSRYMKMQYWEIHDRCAHMDEISAESYFITLTEDPKKDASNLPYLWQHHAQRISNICKEFKRKAGGLYMRVVESQRNGRPHSHLILYLPKKDDSCKLRWSRSAKHFYCYKGIVFDLVSKYWKAGLFDIQKIDERGTANYVTKYVAKTTETNIENAMFSENLNDTQRKEIYTLFISICAGVRLWASSRLPDFKAWRENYLSAKQTKGGDSASSAGEKVLSPREGLQSGNAREAGAAAKPPILIKICNNFPTFPCEREVWEVPRELARTFSAYSKEELAVCKEFTSQLFPMLIYKRRGGGCVVSHFKDWHELGVDDWCSRKERGLTIDETFREYERFSQGANRAPSDPRLYGELKFEVNNIPRYRNEDMLTYHELNLCDRFQTLCDLRVASHFIDWGVGIDPLSRDFMPREEMRIRQIVRMRMGLSEEAQAPSPQTHHWKPSDFADDDANAAFGFFYENYEPEPVF